MATTATLTLPDGRLVAWEDAGPADGAPVLFCHGTPGSRMQRSVFFGESVLGRAGVRMLTPDRPGVGRSQHEPDRQIGDWVGDAASLADHLALPDYGVLGFSGGTPYGIALAAHDPRVATLGIVSGDAPPGAVPEAPAGLPATVSGHPRLSRWVLRLVGLAARVAPGFTADRGTGMLVEADRLVVSEPRARRRFIAMLRDALRQGPEGTARDLELAARWWAVAPPARSVPIHLWHGEADVDSPPAIARYLQERLPGATLETFPGEGHVSAVIRHADAIVRTLGRDLVTAGP